MMGVTSLPPITTYHAGPGQGLMLGKIEKILAEADPGLKSVQALAEECLIRLKNMAIEVSFCSGW